MGTPMQRGYLVLADISGFTSYLSQVELDHAHEILTDLLESIVGQFKALLMLSKLEGDAVFAYGPAAKATRGETLLELLEATYVAFRDRLEAARRRTTCECRACRAIPTLDLKFFVHYGDYIVQQVAGQREMVGSDVNLAHRLMKNHVAEATGWRAYILLTAPALAALGVRPDGLHQQVETYEHLGDVETYSLDLRPRYEALMDQRRVVVTPAEAHLTSMQDYSASPAELWEWLNDPHKRSCWAPSTSYLFRPVVLPGGRTGVGARTHCVHGDKVAVVETILDWRPFDYFTVEQALGGPMSVRGTFQLTPLPNGGTRLELHEHGHATGLALLDRPFFRLVFTKLHPTAHFLAKLAACIEEDGA